MTVTGRQLGRYTLLEELGRGGMAVVYRGRDASLRREVAVKVLHAHLASQPEAMHRFEREAHVVAQLRHPNIVEIFDVAEPMSREPFLVTELLEGRTLRATLDARRFAVPEAGFLVCLPIALALAHAHEQGVVHRDVKPENVMLTASGAVKLMDFGIAYIAGGADLTATGTLIGSPSHMAPELLDGHQADAKSDLFALGTILYECACGTPPFNGNTASAVLKQIAMNQLTAPAEAAPALSKPMAALIEALLAPDPAARPASARTAADMIAASLRGSGIINPELEIAPLLTDPGAEAALRSRVIAVRLSGARDAFHERKVARGLALTAQILAIEPQHAEALALEDAATRAERRRRIARRLAKIAIAGAAVLSIEVAALRLLPGAATRPATIHHALPRVPDAPEKLLAVARRARTRALAEILPRVEAEIAPEEPLAQPRVPLVLHVPAREDLLSEPPATAAIAPVPVNVIVRPWAAIWVDGVLASARAPRHTLSLTPGPHTLELRNPSCAPHTERIVARGGEQLRFDLAYLPAQLTVNGPRGARVLIDGHALGSAGTAIAIPMDGAADRRVAVQLAGSNASQTVHLTAGLPHTIHF